MLTSAVAGWEVVNCEFAVGFDDTGAGRRSFGNVPWGQGSPEMGSDVSVQSSLTINNLRPIAMRRQSQQTERGAPRGSSDNHINTSNCHEAKRARTVFAKLSEAKKGGCDLTDSVATRRDVHKELDISHCVSRNGTRSIIPGRRIWNRGSLRSGA